VDGSNPISIEANGNRSDPLEANETGHISADTILDEMMDPKWRYHREREGGEKMGEKEGNIITIDIFQVDDPPA